MQIRPKANALLGVLVLAFAYGLLSISTPMMANAQDALQLNQRRQPALIDHFTATDPGVLADSNAAIFTVNAHFIILILCSTQNLVID